MATQYATLADFTKYGLRAAALKNLDPADIDAALKSGSGQADDHIGKVCTLPLTAWPESLRKHVVAIAVYDLLSVIGFNPDGKDLNVRMRYDDALKWLRDLGDGKIGTDGFVDSTPTTYEGSAAVVTNTSRGW